MKRFLKISAGLFVFLFFFFLGYSNRYAILPTSSMVNGRALPIYSVETQEPKVALSFDAAWGNEDTKQILEILQKHNIKVTFFMTGGWVNNFPEDVKAIAEAGHDLGNHSANHKNMSKLDTRTCKNEIMDVHEKVKEITGIEMTLFRPPYGDYNNDVVETAYNCGYYPIQWSVDSLDWKDYGRESIISTVADHKNLKNGAIILCHNGAKYTASALEEMILEIQEKGYEIVPISELIYTDNFHMQPDGTQCKSK